MSILYYLLLLVCVACNRKPQSEFGRQRELADAGDVSAQFKVGNSYYFRNSKREHALGLEYLEMAAGNGHMEAQFLVGLMYDIGEGQIGRDSKKSGKFLLRAALQGHAEAQQRMILRTEYGDGVPKSPAKAFVWAVVATALAETLMRRGIGDAWWRNSRLLWFGKGTKWPKHLRLSER